MILQHRFVDKIIIMLVRFVSFPYLAIPLASIPLDIFCTRLYHDKIVSNYIIGGVNPIFGPDWTFENHAKECLENYLWYLGFCKGKEKVFIDSHLIIGVCLFDVGTEIEARIAWEKKKGMCDKKWVPGKVTVAHPDLTYDITYDGGEKEEHVPAGCVRFPSWPVDKTETYAAQERVVGTIALATLASDPPKVSEVIN